MRLPRAWVRSAWACALWSAGWALLIYALPLVPSDGAYGGLDLDRMELGYLCAQHTMLEDGVISISRHLGNGQPSVAEPNMQWFYPPRWVALLFLPDGGRNFSVVFHMALAAAAMSFLLRAFGRSARLSVVVAVAYVLLGTVTDLVQHGSAFLVGAAYVPAAWACAHLLRRGRDVPWLRAGLALSLGALMLGGDPQAALMALLAAGAECLFARCWKRVFLVVGTSGVGVALGCVQWLPTLSSMVLSARVAGFDADTALAWSYDRPLWWATLFPGVLGSWLESDATWLDALFLQDPVTSPWNTAPYVGVVALSLAWVGATLGARRWSVLVVLAASLVLALGLPVMWIPGLNRFRYPAKYLVLVSVALCVLVALGLQWALRKQGARRLRVVATAMGAGVLGVFLGAATLFEDAGGAALASHAMRDTGAAVLACAALVVLMRLNTPWRFWSVSALLIVQLAAGHRSAVGPSLSELASPLKPLMDTSGRGSVLCPAMEYQARAGAISAMAALKMVGGPYLNACDGMTSAFHYAALTPGMVHRLQVGVAQGSWRAVAALGCTHAVLPRVMEPDAWVNLRVPELEAAGVSPDAGAHVVMLKTALPPAALAWGPLLSTETEVLNALKRAQGPAELVGALDDPQRSMPAGWAPPPLSDARVTSVESATPDTWEVTLQGSGGAVVAVNTAFHVGWHATQNGQELPVLRSAGARVAAWVPEVGAGPVRFDYRVPRLVHGAVGTALAWLLLMLLCRPRPAVARAPRAVQQRTDGHP